MRDLQCCVDAFAGPLPRCDALRTFGKILPRVLVLICSIHLTGCDSAPYQIAPVSGIVTLDGKPLEGALVNTQPIAAEDESNPGPGSFAKTDEQGRFTLELVSPVKAGAVVGTHRVRVTKVTVKYAPGKEDAPTISRNLLPKNAADGSLRLTVPPDGTEEIRIELVTK